MYRKISVKFHRALNLNSISKGMCIHIVFTKMHWKQNQHNLSVKYPVMNGALINGRKKNHIAYIKVQCIKMSVARSYGSYVFIIQIDTI